MILGILASLATVLDYIVQVWGTRRFGGSKYWDKRCNYRADNWFLSWSTGNNFRPLIGAFEGEMIFKDDMGYAF